MGCVNAGLHSFVDSDAFFIWLVVWRRGWRVQEPIWMFLQAVSVKCAKLQSVGLLPGMVLLFADVMTTIVGISI